MVELDEGTNTAFVDTILRQILAVVNLDIVMTPIATSTLPTAQAVDILWNDVYLDQTAVFGSGITLTFT